MESNPKKSPKLGDPDNFPDVKYISGLSTILVATIQEAKDRISQIEYIFCSQLFPKFQLNSQSLGKIYSEAREAAKGAYEQKEKDLLHQIENLQYQKHQVLEENQSLKSEKTKYTEMERQSLDCIEELKNELKQKTMEANERREEYQNLQKLLESKSSLLHSYEMTIKELEDRNSTHLQMQKKLEFGSEELRHELMKKSQEVDEVMELQNKLLQMNQTKSTVIVQKDVQLKEYEVRTNGLSSKLENMENKANELLLELKCKVGEVDKGKELQVNMLKKIESQSLELMNSEQLLCKYEKENKFLASEVERLVNRADSVQKELENKSLELEEVRKLKEQLLQNDSFNVERIKRGQVLQELMDERKQLLDKQKGLENEVDKLRKCLSERTVESREGMELHRKLLQQIEVKDSELLAQKKKKMDVITAYKKLKSQYNYLLQKYALTSEAALPLKKMEDETITIGCNQTIIESRVTKKSKTSGIPTDVTNPLDEQHVPEDKKGNTFVQRPGLASPSTSNTIVAAKLANTIKSCPQAGAKCPISHWRDTRSHQSHAGPDPHDNFLDTPLENVKQYLGKAMKEDSHNIPRLGPINMNLGESDDQTQDISADALPQNPHTAAVKAGMADFKFVGGPVRKKSERESLKGVECKQCKKFYDAVLPCSGSGDKHNIRCEHHDGVSRHRYRYLPPSTPEGFWNIGFESECEM